MSIGDTLHHLSDSLRRTLHKGGLAPIALGAAVVGVLVLAGRKATAQPEPVAPPDVPPTPAPPAPPTPVPPDVLPANLATATVNAPSGLRLRSAPNESAGTNGPGLPFNSWVALLTTEPSPATPAAPAGWAHVQTPDGRQGYVSYEWLLFGTAKERGMTPEEEKAYHESHQNRPAPLEQPVETAGFRHGYAWRTPSVAGARVGYVGRDGRRYARTALGVRRIG